MGAGLSGLACAITLEKNGIEPVIFEKRSQVGDRFINGEIMLSVLNRPVRDSIAYLAEEYGIYLKPVGNIKRLILYSEREMAQVTGHIGFSNIRGRDADSFDRQLENQVKSKIVFNSDYSYEELLQDFTHVVMATGDAAYTGKIQNYQQDLTVTLKGATVEGEFNRYTVRAWLNNRLAPKGYGYLIPLSNSEAQIVISYPDYPENQKEDLGKLWDRFYNRVCQDLEQDFKVTDRFEVTRYIIGTCQYPRIGNTYFVGNCFGVINPFLGFGQFNALLTGIYAGLSISGKGSYAELTEGIRKNYHNSLVLRRAFEQLSNKGYDRLVKRIKGRLGNFIFKNTSLDPLKYASYFLKPWLRFKGRHV